MKKYLLLFVTLLFMPFFVFGQEQNAVDEVVQVESNDVTQETEANFVETDRLSWEEIDEIMSSDDWGADNIANNFVV